MVGGLLCILIGSVGAVIALKWLFKDYHEADYGSEAWKAARYSDLMLPVSHVGINIYDILDFSQAETWRRC